MLVDAAKHGDVEIPVFCYEPKLGQPVGACRMCLVEIEGIPKLQTGCSTPVKDGMVVHTQTDRVQRGAEGGRRVPARQPPARLPGLRQGRRVPAAGHLVRLGPRELALHRAQAPLREAARAVAADRDRPRALHPLLPLRALPPGDLRGLPADPARARRAHLRRHLRRPPLRRAVQRQHHRAVPGRRADLAALPLPRAPVGHRGRRARSARCARRSATSSFTVRDERVLRVLARDNAERRRRLAVRQGPLRLPGDPRRRAHHRAAGARRRRAAPGLAGSARSSAAAGALGRRAAASARSPAAQTTNEEGFLLQRLMREALGSHDLDSRPARHRCRCDAARARWPPRRCRRPSPTSSSPTPCSCSAASRSTTSPILDLRIRKGVRRHGVQARGRDARARSSLDANATLCAALRARRRARVPRRAGRRARRGGDVDALCAAADADPKAVRALADAARATAARTS